MFSIPITTGLAILQGSQRFAMHAQVPLTIEILEIAYCNARDCGFSPAYLLQEAIQIAETKELLGKIPTEITS